MTEGYTRWVKRSSLSDQQTRCDRHRTTTFGVLQGRRLRAYSTVHRRGDLAMISMILGHGDHQTAGIMYLLMRGMVAHEAGQGGWFFYNTWASGTEGLRFKKARYGFAPADIEWSL